MDVHNQENFSSKKLLSNRKYDLASRSFMFSLLTSGGVAVCKK